jgi:polysaccharide biosynthesis/export protein
MKLRRAGSAVLILGVWLGIGIFSPRGAIRAADLKPNSTQSVFQDEKLNPLEVPPEDFKPLEEQRQLEAPMKALLREEPPTLGQPIEGPVDPKEYRMGPGDLVAVFVVSKVEQQLLARVTADGMLRIPSLGLFNVQNRLYGEVRDEVLAVAQKRYKAEAISVSLIELREFKASVGGLVWAPGTYKVNAVDRAASLIARAGGFYHPHPGEEKPNAIQIHGMISRLPEQDRTRDLPNYSTRHAQLIHRDGSTSNVDLLLFLRAGLPEGNPHLRDGDFLLIPPLNPQTSVLGIFGAVNQQGTIEYLPGDNLNKALLLAGNLTGDARRDSIEITRFSDSGSNYQTFYVNLDSPGSVDTELKADDRIFIRQKTQYHRLCQAEIRGEVSKPGYYPIPEAGSKLSNLLKLAGGVTDRASLSQAVLVRKQATQVDAEYERLLGANLTEKNKLESEYLKIKTRELGGRVVVNLYKLIEEGDSASDVTVLDGDVLIIPEISHTVILIGQLKNPGITIYTPGSDYKDYVESVGGFANNADRLHVKVIKARTGTWVKAGSAVIEEGDTIFVPGKPDFDYWQFTKDAMLVITQFATIYLIVNNTTK